MLNKKNVIAGSLFTVLLTGCGGGSDDNTSSPKFSLGVSDAPIADLSEVVVCFNQIELKGSNTKTVFTVGKNDGDNDGMISANDLCLDDDGSVIPNTVGIDLKQYTGSNSIYLVDDINIEAGDYTQLRLVMSDGSYGIDAQTGEKISVSIPAQDTPSGKTPPNELKLDGFTATLGGVVDFTLEFDLRKAMTDPKNQDGYLLKPRGVRLVDNNEAGHIEGTVSETLLSDNQCTPLSDPTANVASVYIYKGADLAIETLEDNGGDEAKNLPYASTTVTFDSQHTSYNFEIGFIQTGEYTLAISCDVEDDPEVDEDINFITSQNITVETGTTEVSF
ncbi:MAG: DUF4382 domain-containing protein [Colwellia sp.]|nr:DUF4382 domain-containing protein [Colwellia sp.]